MPKIIDVIKRLCPKGTSLSDTYSWKAPPFWPPDAFAVAATLVNLAGCYANRRYSVAGSSNCLFSTAFLEVLHMEGASWGSNPLPDSVTPTLVRDTWNQLMVHAETVVVMTDDQGEQAWWDAAVTLLCLADVASAGIGFYAPWEPTSMGYLAYRSLFYVGQPDETHKSLLWDARYSLGWMVDPHEAVVQPKSRTPQVGCTLRSLTHNLCLLPQVGEIVTSWRYGPFRASKGAEALIGPPAEEPLNLLLVPFPYHIDSTSFFPGPDVQCPAGRFFDVRQDWLTTENRRLTPDEFVGFLFRLVEAARKETRRVHGIVLPEAALSRTFAESVAKLLAEQGDLEFFVTGSTESTDERTAELPMNQVASYIFQDKRIFNRWEQSKHHRWKLDGGQIRRYHLGDALDHRQLWWERINLVPRQCSFYVFRHGASMATLVCEDLARIDPVQTVLRAVGPNLVIVLLMDGPQLEKRWPGRYATVLADDPGSAVLTLTSLGMVRRSRMPGERERREIALWKEPGGEAKELILPEGCHGLLLTLSQWWNTNYTLDGRPDGPVDDGGTMQLSLTGVRGVAHPKPESWVDDQRRLW